MDLPISYESLTPKQKREVRIEYIKRQSGKCWYCEEPLNKDAPDKITSKPINLKLFPTGFLTHPVHLHHDHSTGLTIGAVHSYCNAVLWQYEGK